MFPEPGAPAPRPWHRFAADTACSGNSSPEPAGRRPHNERRHNYIRRSAGASRFAARPTRGDATSTIPARSSSRDTRAVVQRSPRLCKRGRAIREAVLRVVEPSRNIRAGRRAVVRLHRPASVRTRPACQRNFASSTSMDDHASSAISETTDMNLASLAHQRGVTVGRTHLSQDVNASLRPRADFGVIRPAWPARFHVGKGAVIGARATVMWASLPRRWLSWGRWALALGRAPRTSCPWWR